AGTIVDDAGYGDFAGYLELPTADYQLSITDETGETEVAVFGAPLSSLNLDGQALTILASGFLNPDNNSGGPAFGLYVALSSGGELVELTNTTSVEENTIAEAEWKLYPNPARQTATVTVDESATDAVVRMLNVTGKVLDEKQLQGKRSVDFNVADYPNGIYLISIVNGNSSQTRKLQILK
ncbi:MAG: T9SS type A sorting domain-containing protein, partial [Bacteroidota bacterium]